MKLTLLTIVGLSMLIALSGCNSEEKALESSAPPVSDNASTYENGGQPKDVGANEGQASPAAKPAGM
jgi:hypothetical protein